MTDICLVSQWRCRCVRVSPAREDAVFQACGLTAEPTALVAGRTAAGQRGTRRWEGSDQQAAQGSFRDGGKDKQQKGHLFLKENILKQANGSLIPSHANFF